MTDRATPGVPTTPNVARSAKDREPPLPDPLPGSAFDAHCHLDAMAHRAGLEPTREFVADVMARARKVNVTEVITVGDTLASSAWCVQAASEHPDVYAAVAYAELESLARHPRVVAVGETGLDYYWDRTTPADQQEHFRRHIELAKRVRKTLMIHDRDAHADVLRILSEQRAPDRVVFHAFSGDSDMARACVGAGYVLSVAGVVTFTNAPLLRQAVGAVNANQILLETDAPFLTPHPFRGRPNSPYLLAHTVLAVARILGVTPVDLCSATRRTGNTMFGFGLT